MFRFTQEPSSGSRSQCLTKITGMVPGYLLICSLPVLWRHISACCECAWLAVQEYPPAQRAKHTHNSLEYAAIAMATKHINKYAGTIL